MLARSPWTINNLVGVVQICFFLTIASVTVLTYRRAKRTLLQPFQTEIFKKQFELFETILRLFVGKPGHQLLADLDWERMVQANRDKLVSNYATRVFAEDLDDPLLIHERVRMSRSLMVLPADAMVHVLSGPYRPEEGEEGEASTVESWSDERHSIVHITDAHADHMSTVEVLAAHPMLPTKLRALLVQYEELVSERLHILVDLQDRCARELPIHYPTMVELRQYQHVWMHEKGRDLFTENDTRIVEVANSIVEFVQSYYSPDELFG